MRTVLYHLVVVPWSNLCDFMNRNNLSCFDYFNLPCDTFSYTVKYNTYICIAPPKQSYLEHYAHSHCKWLDHLIGKLQNEIELKSINVFYDMIGADHLSIHLNLYIPEKSSSKNHLNINNNEEKRTFINWKIFITNILLYCSFV